MAEYHPKIANLVRFIVRRQLLIFPLALAGAILAGYFASKLKLESNLAALLPEDYPSVQSANKVKEQVGGFETLQILVEGQDFASMVSYAAEIAARLEADDLVTLVDWRKDVAFFEKNALLYVSLDDLKQIRHRIYARIERERSKHSPFAEFRDRQPTRQQEGDTQPLSLADIEAKYSPTDKQRYYINDAKTLLVLNVYPDGSNANIAFARKFYRQVKAIVETIDATAYHPSLQAHYGGNFKNKIDEYEVIISDVTSTLGYSLLAVAIVVALTLRQVFAIVVVGIPLLIGIAWNFGLVYAVIGRLNTMTVFLFMVLFGLGIDFGIHFFSRYMQERRAGLSVDDALETTMLHKGRAFFDAAATTMAAFYSLMLADFRGFYEFGFIAGNGVGLTLLSTLLTAPGMFKLAERLGLLWRIEKKTTSVALDRPTRNPMRWTPRLVMLATMASVGFAVMIMPTIGFQYDFSELRAELPASRAVKQKLRTIFDESNSPALVLTASEAELQEVAAWVKHRKETDPTPTIDKFRSAFTVLPKDQDEKIHELWRLREMLTDERIQRLPANERAQIERLMPYIDVQKVGVDDLPENVKRVFRSRDGRLDGFGLIYPSVALKDGRNSIAFKEDIATIRMDDGKIFYAVNSSVIIADMLIMMLREGSFAVVTTLLAVFLLVAIDFRSLKTGIIVMTPFLVGLLWLAIDMYVEGMMLNFFNVVALPAIIGISIDIGVHIYHRYQEYGHGSIRKVMLTSLDGILGSSLTGIVGFGGLMFAHHGGLKAIGDLAVRGIGLTLLATLIVMPAMLALFEQMTPKRVKTGPLRVPVPGGEASMDHVNS